MQGGEGQQGVQRGWAAQVTTKRPCSMVRRVCKHVQAFGAQIMRAGIAVFNAGILKPVWAVCGRPE